MKIGEGCDAETPGPSMAEGNDERAACVRAVVFDLDGLMFDTEALYFRVAGEMLAARGKAFTPEMMAALIGRRAAEAGHVFQTMAGCEEPLDVLLADTR